MMSDPLQPPPPPPLPSTVPPPPPLPPDSAKYGYTGKFSSNIGGEYRENSPAIVQLNSSNFPPTVVSDHGCEEYPQFVSTNIARSSVSVISSQNSTVESKQKLSTPDIQQQQSVKTPKSSIAHYCDLCVMKFPTLHALYDHQLSIIHLKNMSHGSSASYGPPTANHPQLRPPSGPMQPNYQQQFSAVSNQSYQHQNPRQQHGSPNKYNYSSQQQQYRGSPPSQQQSFRPQSSPVDNYHQAAAPRPLLQNYQQQQRFNGPDLHFHQKQRPCGPSVSNYQQQSSVGPPRQDYQQPLLEYHDNYQYDRAPNYQQTQPLNTANHQPSFLQHQDCHSIPASYIAPVTGQNVNQADESSSDCSSEDEDWSYCKCCELKMNSSQAYNQHCRGIMHSQHAMEFKEKRKRSKSAKRNLDPARHTVPEPNVLTTVQTWKNCECCELHFESPREYNVHCETEIHVKNTADKTVAQAKEDEKNQEAIYCANCNLYFDMQEEYFKHLRSDEHRESVSRAMRSRGKQLDRAIMKTDESGDVIFEMVGVTSQELECWYCKICDVQTTDQSGFDDHMTGKRHQKKMEQEKKLQLAVEIAANVQKKQFSINEDVSVPINEGTVLLNNGTEVQLGPTGKQAKVQISIDSYHEPLLGTDLIVEYLRPPDCEAIYTCELCEAKCDSRVLIPHLIGAKHRIKFFKKIDDLEVLNQIRSFKERSRQSEASDFYAKEYEQRNPGRGKLKQILGLPPDFKANRAKAQQEADRKAELRRLQTANFLRNGGSGADFSDSWIGGNDRFGGLEDGGVFFGASGSGSSNRPAAPPVGLSWLGQKSTSSAGSNSPPPVVAPLMRRGPRLKNAVKGLFDRLDLVEDYPVGISKSVGQIPRTIPPIGSLTPAPPPWVVHDTPTCTVPSTGEHHDIPHVDDVNAPRVGEADDPPIYQMNTFPIDEPNTLASRPSFLDTLKQPDTNDLPTETQEINTDQNDAKAQHDQDDHYYYDEESDYAEQEQYAQHPDLNDFDYSNERQHLDSGPYNSNNFGPSKPPLIMGSSELYAQGIRSNTPPPGPGGRGAGLMKAPPRPFPSPYNQNGPRPEHFEPRMQSRNLRGGLLMHSTSDQNFNNFDGPPGHDFRGLSRPNFNGPAGPDLGGLSSHNFPNQREPNFNGQPQGFRGPRQPLVYCPPEQNFQELYGQNIGGPPNQGPPPHNFQGPPNQGPQQQNFVGPSNPGPPLNFQGQGPPHNFQGQGPAHNFQGQGPAHNFQGQGPPHNCQVPQDQGHSQQNLNDPQMGPYNGPAFVGHSSEEGMAFNGRRIDQQLSNEKYGSGDGGPAPSGIGQGISGVAHFGGSSSSTTHAMTTTNKSADQIERENNIRDLVEKGLLPPEMLRMSPEPVKTSIQMLSNNVPMEQSSIPVAKKKLKLGAGYSDLPDSSEVCSFEDEVTRRRNNIGNLECSSSGPGPSNPVSSDTNVNYEIGSGDGKDIVAKLLSLVSTGDKPAVPNVAVKNEDKSNEVSNALTAALIKYRLQKVILNK